MRSLVIAFVVLACPAGAAAATVQLDNTGPGEHGTVDDYWLRFYAQPDEANAVTIVPAPDGVLVRDAGAPLLAVGGFCRQAIDGVLCAPGRRGVVRDDILVDLGDGDDRLVVARYIVDVQDGPGDDVIEIPRGRFFAGLGRDVMRVSGIGASAVIYGDRWAPVGVTQDGQANDGEAGEHDDVGYGIDNVSGGRGDDVLVAGDRSSSLSGGGGSDLLVGGPADDGLVGDGAYGGVDGNDTLLGGGGNDMILGGPGGDVIRGGPGMDTMGWPHVGTGVRVTLDDRPGDGVPGEDDDVGSDVELLDGTRYDDVIVGSDGPQHLRGGDGDDRLDGGGGNDWLEGGPGNRNVLTGGGGVDRIDSIGAQDTIRSRDGARDSVRCGRPSSGRRRFEADAFDTLRSCASRLVVREGQRLRVDAHGRIRLAVSCPRGRGACAGRVRLVLCRPRHGTVGRADFRLADGARRRIAVRLTRAARRAVVRRGTACVDVSARTHRTRPPVSAVESGARIVVRR